MHVIHYKHGTQKVGNDWNKKNINIKSAIVQAKITYTTNQLSLNPVSCGRASLIEVNRGLVSQSNVPTAGCNVPCDDGLLGGVRGDPEGEWLAAEGGERLIRRAPVVAHADPPSLAPLDGHAADVSSPSHVQHVYQQPVSIPLETESDPTLLNACYSATGQYWII